MFLSWDVGKVIITVEHAGLIPPASYTIERKDGDGSFQTIATINASEVQNSYTYQERLPGNSLPYSYRIIALDDQGQIIAQSPERTLQ